jgi:hypothetical protein
VIDLHSAEALSSYAMFFYNCKIFGLRGMNEHVNLVFEQYEFGYHGTGEFLICNDRLSKNVQGGLSRRKVEVKHYSSPNNPNCFAKLLKEYTGCIKT